MTSYTLAFPRNILAYVHTNKRGLQLKATVSLHDTAVLACALLVKSMHGRSVLSYQEHGLST